MNDLIQHVEYKYKVIFHYKHPDHEYMLNRCHYFKFYDVYDADVNKRMYERVAHYAIDEFYKNVIDNEVLVAFEIVIEDKYISPVLIHDKEGEKT